MARGCIGGGDVWRLGGQLLHGDVMGPFPGLRRIIGRVQSIPGIGFFPLDGRKSWGDPLHTVMCRINVHRPGQGADG